MSDSQSDAHPPASTRETNDPPAKKTRAPRRAPAAREDNDKAPPSRRRAPRSESAADSPAPKADVPVKMDQLSTDELRMILAAREAAEARRSAPAPAHASPAETSEQRLANSDQQSQHSDRESRQARRERRNRRDRGRRNRNDRNDRPRRPEYAQDQGYSSQPAVVDADYENLPPSDAPDDGTTHEPVFAEGIVEVSGKGFGFLREAKRDFVQHPGDVFVTPEVIRKFSLRDGMWIKGEIRRGSRGPQMYRLTELERAEPDPEKMEHLPSFDELTTINPNERIKLETVPDRYTTRIIDLMTPVGKGQRGLIVAPPRTGKTTLLQHIASAVVKNYPEMQLIILLVDERPEEVTEIRRTVPQAEIMASSNDSDLKSHTRIAQLAIERARRLVEMGKDVFILLDSLTRVGRAFNNAQSGSGRTLSGGMDARAMEIPRKLFAAARNTEEAGSLTILATALIDTGSRMDELIFQEFKGTGNMELVLDRKISDQRTYPAVDIFLSGTRREELLLPPDDLHKINVIRRGLAGHKPSEAIDRLLMLVRKFPTNAQLLREIPG